MQQLNMEWIGIARQLLFPGREPQVPMEKRQPHFRRPAGSAWRPRVLLNSTEGLIKTRDSH